MNWSTFKEAWILCSHDLQGEYADLDTPTARQNLTTNQFGQFAVESPRPATYTFAPQDGYLDQCIDASTGVKVTFPMHLKLPVVRRTVVTAISLLTVPASADYANDPISATNDSTSRQLWNSVYGMFGYDADALKVCKPMRTVVLDWASRIGY